MAEITLLYNMPLIVTVDTEEKVVTSVVEDYDNINLATGPLNDIYAWEGLDGDQFWRQMDTTDDDDKALSDVAVDIAESESWPAREA